MITEQLLSEIAEGKGEQLRALARRVPSYRHGRPATLSRLIRWILDGVLAPTGERVRLEAVKGPAGWISTPGALARFLAALTPRPTDEPTPATRTPAARRRASERAAEKLDEIGI
jgi:hypothetical protein